MSNDTVQEILDRILADLKSDEKERELAAIQQLDTMKFSSQAVVLQLEQLALHKTDEVRDTALHALLLQTSQFVSSKTSPLNKISREMILREITGWEKNGLIEAHRAEVLRRRYDFDLKPGIAIRREETQEEKPVEAAPVQPAAPVTPQPVSPPRPAEPRPSLTQILLSETSIRIYLYLGAFFVIASAAILAALVEAARLPILLAATMIFAIGATGLKKRLPQPSFALAVVFSFLLPIDAGVVADSLDLSGPIGHGYWAGIFVVMAFIWALGTWFYESRMFSIASFLAAVLSLFRITNAFNASEDIILFSFSFSALIGLFGVYSLKSWKGQSFSMPLFLTAQIVQGLTLFVSLGMVAAHLFESDVAWSVWLSHTLIWILAASFFAASGLLIPFVLFPWAAVASLFLVPWLFLSTFDTSASVQIAGFGIWGTVMALASELTNRAKDKAIHSYSLPSLLVSLPLFFVSILWGLIEGIPYAFTTFLLTGLAYTVIHALRPRWYVWSVALLSGLGAYFALFALPFMEKLDVYIGYQLLIASLILLIPQLFFKDLFTLTRPWNWPPVVFGILLTSINLLITHLLLIDSISQFDRAAVILGVYAVLSAAYAVRLRQPRIGYFGTTFFALAVLYTLNHFDLDLWLPFLTVLGVVYYFSGFFLTGKAPAWGKMLITSGLVLGGIISTIAVLTLKATGGWYVIIVSTLFIIEMFTRRNGYLELPALALLTFALIIILNDLKVTELAYYLFGSSLIWLGGDAILHQTYQSRNLHNISRLIGGLGILVTVMTITLNNGLASVPAAICFAVYTAFFAAYALFYNKPVLGYLSTASAAATMFYTLDHFKIEAWLPIFTGLSLVYYLAGYFLRRSNAGWSEMFRYSGLTLGSLVSVIALVSLEATGGWYAAIVGVLFIVETVSTRNGWFEAGVHILFSVAAFLILRDFNVHEYSYILFALSLVWLGGDALFEKTFKARTIGKAVWIIGAGIAGINALSLLSSPYIEAAICYGGYAVFFGAYALLRNQSLIGYASTVSLPLAVFTGLHSADETRWLFPIIVIAVLYYTAGYILRLAKRQGWDMVLLFSGIGLGVITALLAPAQPGGIEKAIPIAIAATLFAVEAFTRRDIWLALAANMLYLTSYFTLLVELKVDEPQYFSIGAALLGMFMHYLFVRTGSKVSAFITGTVSQLALLGTSYIQMVSTSQVSFFFVLFVQSLVIIAYGIYMRSRSLVLAPIGIVVLAILTILYSTLKDLSLVVIIGVAGIVLLVLGVLAVLMRERITTLAERFSDWNA